MSGKKSKLLRKYLEKRNATNKVYLTKTDNGKVNRLSVSKEIKESYKTANSKDKRLLNNFFKDVIK